CPPLLYRCLIFLRLHAGQPLWPLSPYTTLFRSRRGAVGGFEARVLIRYVGARRNADAAHLRSQRVGEIVAVQVGGGDHIVVGGRSEEHTSELQSRENLV